MSLITDVNARITQAMKAHDSVVLSVFRMLKTALVNKEVEKGHALEDAEARQVIGTMIKQRRESIDQFLKGGRQDLVDKETAELKQLETLMPPPVSAEDIQTAIDSAIATTGATGMKDMGRLMKAVMAALAGNPVDGKTVNDLVRKKLAGG
ncbi:MAG: GatB/YqeY domain-containing protein [Acidobacteria bacterium]|nr:GatB/YqeY domain-containing protein [Acidobacteriota bacterium]